VERIGLLEEYQIVEAISGRREEEYSEKTI
jgi:hypothetical protein